MTAINMIVRKRSACIMADGAHYGPDGRIANIAAKIIQLPHLRAAFAVRGMRGVTHVLHAAIEEAHISSFDDLWDRFVDVA